MTNLLLSIGIGLVILTWIGSAAVLAWGIHDAVRAHRRNKSQSR